MTRRIRQAYYTSEDHVYSSHFIELMVSLIIGYHNMVVVHMLSDQPSGTLNEVMRWWSQEITLCLEYSSLPVKTWWLVCRLIRMLFSGRIPVVAIVFATIQAHIVSTWRYGWGAILGPEISS